MFQTNPRPPIVAILGHVDHGKTTLLDFIRKSRLASVEVGGITQRIGGYEIDTEIKGYPTSKITFIDTPGHEAFSQLRARGAQVSDIAVLIVDGKDSVMPQTVESISHIKSANIPFLVAINKVDLPDINIEKVKNDLAKNEVFVEGKGGDTVVVPISAKTGAGVSDLLETILLLASEQNLQFSKEKPLQAYVIETKKDKRGIVVSAVIKDGVLNERDLIYAADNSAKIRKLINDLGKPVSYVVPSTPFEMLGFEKMPEVGSMLSNKPVPKVIPIVDQPVSKPPGLDLLLNEKKTEKKLKLVLKADSAGSQEAVVAALTKKKNIELILKAVGEVNKSDIFLAKTTSAIVIGFSVPVSKEIVEFAKQEKVIIKTYNLIYELLEELAEVADILKEKEEKEKNYKGEAKILATFIIDRENIIGVKITKGKINLGDQIEAYRDGQYLGKTKLVSLKVRAKTLPEVKKDQEAGMVMGPPLDIKVGDMVKSIL